ncbi:MAG: hypothetical protein P9L99_13345 [Candidatus Lernaella stagnicola]|nr:hypothetical protein [Candidatus Lernaella stagnicola]
MKPGQAHRRPWYRRKRVWFAAALVVVIAAKLAGVPLPFEAIVPTLVGLIAGDDTFADDDTVFYPDAENEPDRGHTPDPVFDDGDPGGAD